MADTLTIHELADTRRTPKSIVIVEATIAFGCCAHVAMAQMLRRIRRVVVMVVGGVAVRVKAITSGDRVVGSRRGVHVMIGVGGGCGVVAVGETVLVVVLDGRRELLVLVVAEVVVMVVVRVVGGGVIVGTVVMIVVIVG